MMTCSHHPRQSDKGPASWTRCCLIRNAEADKMRLWNDERIVARARKPEIRVAVMRIRVGYNCRPTLIDYAIDIDSRGKENDQVSQPMSREALGFGLFAAWS